MKALDSLTLLKVIALKLLSINFRITFLDVDDEQYGIADTQPPNEGIVVGLNNVRPTDFFIDHRHADVNEDATLYTNDDNSTITSNIENGR